MKSIEVLLMMAVVHGQDSNFFIGLYETPLGVDHMAFPVNYCVRIPTGSEANIFATYQCNEAGDTVTYIEYADDNTCSDEAVADVGATYTMDGLVAGQLFSFNCNGVDNYGVAKTMADDPSCCSSEDILYVPVATDVCYLKPSGVAAMAICTATNGVEYVYDQSNDIRDGLILCSDEDRFVDPLWDISIDQCGIMTNSLNGVQVNWIMDVCIEDGIPLALNTFCDNTNTDGTTLSPQSTAQGTDTSSTVRPERTTTERPERTTTARPEITTTERPERTTTEGPERTTTARPDTTTTERPERTTREPLSTEPQSTRGDAPQTTGDRPQTTSRLLQTIN